MPRSHQTTMRWSPKMVPAAQSGSNSVYSTGWRSKLPAATDLCCRHSRLFLIAMPGCTPCSFEYISKAEKQQHTSGTIPQTAPESIKCAGSYAHMLPASRGNYRSCTAMIHCRAAARCGPLYYFGRVLLPSGLGLYVQVTRCAIWHYN